LRNKSFLKKELMMTDKKLVFKVDEVKGKIAHGVSALTLASLPNL